MIKTPFTYIILIFLAGASFFSCDGDDIAAIKKSASVFDIEQGKASIDQSNLRFVRYFKDGDSTKISNLYTGNARLMVDHLGTIKGRDSIQHYFSGLVKKGLTSFKLETENVSGDSTVLVEEGFYTISGGNGKAVDEGKYIVLWKQESGNWKMHHEMLASNLPSDALLPYVDTMNVDRKPELKLKPKK